MNHHKTKVAVVGGGISGIAAAYRLSQFGYQVVLIESRHEIGGDCRSLSINFDNMPSFDIDIGVNDFNQSNFVQFSQFLERIGIETRPIIQDASFVTANGRTLYMVRDSTVQLPSESKGGTVQSSMIISYDGAKTDSVAISHEINRMRSMVLEVLAED